MSTTVLPRTCPDWCKYSQEDHQRHDAPPEKRLHGSAEIGLFEFWQIEGEEITATLIPGVGSDHDLTPESLHTLAAAALAAAQWLEAHA